MSLYTHLDQQPDGTFLARVEDIDTKQEVLRYTTDKKSRLEIERMSAQKVAAIGKPAPEPEPEPQPTAEELAARAYALDVQLAKRYQRMEALGMTTGLAAVVKRLSDNFQPGYEVFF